MAKKKPIKSFAQQLADNRNIKYDTGEEEILKMKGIGYTDEHEKYAHEVRVPVKESYTNKSKISSVGHKTSVKASRPKYTESGINTIFNNLETDMKEIYKTVTGKKYPEKPSETAVTLKIRDKKYKGKIKDLQKIYVGNREMLEHEAKSETHITAESGMPKRHKKDTSSATYAIILLLIGTYLMSTYIPKNGITGNYILNSGASLFTLLFMIVVLIVALVLIKNTFFKKEVVKAVRKKSRTKRKAKSRRRK